MNRKETYRIQKSQRKIRIWKLTAFLVFAVNLFCFSLSSWSFDTHSYFTAEAASKFTLKNATESELIKVTVNPTEYSKCVATVPVIIKNIFNDIVVITIDKVTYHLEPGEEKKHEEVVSNNCGQHGNRTFHIIGYNHYFDHPITVDLDKDNKCPDPAIENGKGNSNDNEVGNKCGQQGENHKDNGKDKDDKGNGQNKNNGSPEDIKTVKANQSEENSSNNEDKVSIPQVDASADSTIVNSEVKNDQPAAQTNDISTEGTPSNDTESGELQGNEASTSEGE